MSDSLTNIRKKIDSVDKAILDLLKKRVQLSWQVRQEKLAKGEALDTPVRETKIVEQLLQYSDEWITASDIQELWPNFIKRSKANAQKIDEG